MSTEAIILVVAAVLHVCASAGTMCVTVWMVRRMLRVYDGQADIIRDSIRRVTAISSPEAALYCDTMEDRAKQAAKGNDDRRMRDRLAQTPTEWIR